jgi:hypothetical protein
MSPSRLIVLLGLPLGVWLLLFKSPSGVSGSGSVSAPTDKAYAAATAGYVSLPFSTLGAVEYSDGMPVSALPAVVRESHGTKVAVHGFMLPLDVTRAGVSHFLLNPSYDMCMFGAASGSPTQWVEVVMPAGRPAEYTHLPITVIGRFALGERRERGRLVSIYRVDADRVITAGS